MKIARTGGHILRPMQRIAIAALIVLAAAAAVAQPGPGRRPRPEGRPDPEAVARYLNLSEAQKITWEATHAEMRATMQPLHEKMRATHDRLRALLDSGSNDAAAVGNLMLTIRATDKQIRAAHDNLASKLQSILSAEQKARWEAFHESIELVRPDRARPTPPRH